MVRILVASALPLFLVACASSGDVCREPTVTEVDDETTMCVATLDRCESAQNYVVTCDNSTFDGSWACNCLSEDGTSTYTSEFGCNLPDVALAEDASAGCRWHLTIEPEADGMTRD